jgi:hypothetical protein
MKKAGLAYVANCNEDRLTSMMKRQKDGLSVMPFDIVPHQHYTLAEAHQLRAVLDLVDNNGIELSEACYVTQAIGELPRHPLNHMRSEGDLWIGAGLVWDESFPGYWKFKVAGFFGDLATQSNAKMEREFSSCELARTVSVNVSRSADYVRKRALELGLPEGEDYSDAFLVKRLTRGR